MNPMKHLHLKLPNMTYLLPKDNRVTILPLVTLTNLLGHISKKQTYFMFVISMKIQKKSKKKIQFHKVYYIISLLILIFQLLTRKLDTTTNSFLKTLNHVPFHTSFMEMTGVIINFHTTIKHLNHALHNQRPLLLKYYLIGII